MAEWVVSKFQLLKNDKSHSMEIRKEESHFHRVPCQMFNDTSQRRIFTIENLFNSILISRLHPQYHLLTGEKLWIRSFSYKNKLKTEINSDSMYQGLEGGKNFLLEALDFGLIGYTKKVIHTVKKSFFCGENVNLRVKT